MIFFYLSHILRQRLYRKKNHYVNRDTIPQLQGLKLSNNIRVKQQQLKKKNLETVFWFRYLYTSMY